LNQRKKFTFRDIAWLKTFADKKTRLRLKTKRFAIPWHFSQKPELKQEFGRSLKDRQPVKWPNPTNFKYTSQTSPIYPATKIVNRFYKITFLVTTFHHSLWKVAHLAFFNGNKK
jgi:hypothetical protein